MADLDDNQSAQSVKIVGADSTGLETTPVESTSYGELLIGEKNLHRSIAGPQTVVVKASPGFLRRIVINRTANGSVTIYDNTTATGTPIIVIGLSNGTPSVTLEYGFSFSTGLTVVTTGSNTDISVLYL